MEEKYKIKSCRICKSENLMPIISLGNQYVVGFVSNKEEGGTQVPLDLVLCNECKLLQLKHNAPPESMWGEQYWYKSGINPMIRANLEKIVGEIKKMIELDKEDIVIDIGCNDGTMLGYYDNCANLVGFEPSKNVAEEAKEKGLNVINNFFNAKNFKDSFEGKKAKVISAISMFYDLEDPNSFMEDIVEILDKDGLFIIQQNYVASMLKNNAFDNICHEHREYYSLYSLNNLLEKYGLEIFDVHLNELNGGSIRTYIKFKENSNITPFEGAKERLEKIKNDEIDLQLNTSKPYLDFANRIEKIKKETMDFLKKEKAAGKKICGCGASTRGSVILQYFGLGPEMIDCLFDKNSDKEGKMPAGSWIPITSPDNIDKYNPDYQFVVIWHLFKSLGDDEKNFVQKGGKFILPLPEFKIIDSL